MNKRPYNYKLTEAEAIEMMNRITRRRFIGAGGAAIGTALVGCAAPPVRQAAPTSAPATRRIQHAGGETEIPAKPQRIVSLEPFALTWTLLQLGIEPVGTSISPDVVERVRSVEPETAKRMEEIPSLGSGAELSIERIAALKPDLIIGMSWQVDNFDTLSKIAPTILLAYQHPDGIIGWQNELGNLIGAEGNNDFTTLLVEYRQKVQALKDKYPDLWPKLEWTRLTDYSGSFYVADTFPLSCSYTILTELGARPSKTVAQLKDDPQVSMESLPEFDADVIFVTGPDAKPNMDAMKLLANTFAGERNQVFNVAHYEWSYANIRTCLVVLDNIEEAFANRTIDTSGDFR